MALRTRHPLGTVAQGTRPRVVVGRRHRPEEGRTGCRHRWRVGRIQGRSQEVAGRRVQQQAAAVGTCCAKCDDSHAAERPRHE